VKVILITPPLELTFSFLGSCWKQHPPPKKKRLGWVQDWVGDWFWEALPAVGKLPMCRRSQECSRISLHRTFLVPLRLLLSANPSRYRDSCCTTMQLLQLQHTKSNYYYNIQIKTISLTHMGWTFFVLCCLQKEHPTSVAKPRFWKDIPSPNKELHATCAESAHP
jgi:hypothetical protein